MARTVILGTGSGAPDRIVTNRDLERLVDTSDEWITQRSGIRERRMVGPGGKWSDFMVPACRSALAMAGVEAGELDLIIAGTLTPDMFMPSGGCTLQAALGASRAAAFDLGAACSGFVYGLTVADRFIRAEPHLKILVAGGEVVSQRIDWTDRTTAVLFGDGGGAAVVTGTEEPGRGILASRIRSDGTLWELLYLPGGASQHPPTPEYDARMNAIHMRGNELFKVAVKSMEDACRQVLAEAGVAGEAVDLVVPHQANLRIIQLLADRLGVPMDRVFVNIERYGNTSAGTIPLALDEAVRGGRVKPGDLVLLPVFGGGLTWGALLLRW
ncbi:MAG: beta-ketoacyl-ACP synthase III [Deferrisomatales bacterium]